MDLCKGRLCQLRIQMEKIIKKEQDQQYWYASYYVKNVDAQDRLIPRRTQAKVHLRGILHYGKDLIARQPAQSTVCSELSTLNTRICPTHGQLNILTSTPAMEHRTDCYSQGDIGSMKNQCENIYFEDCYLSHRGSN